VSKLFEQRLKRLSDSAAAATLQDGLKGIEKESLRVTGDGFLSQRPHPRALGSPLTNRFITTDFSEALLEFVTPAVPETWQALRDLCDIHQFCYRNLDDELLWVTSMPCLIPEDPGIPLARYGSSNVGRMKTIYRNGLGYRYGRAMQTIAGLHFNYSVPEAFWDGWQELERNRDAPGDFRSNAYLGLLRNFRRLGWLVLYVSGASPAVCRSFSAANPERMQALGEGTLFEPYATSLRMSDLGYSNRSQARLNISLNRLEDYVADLSRAISTPDARFERIGVKVDGEYRQLSANVLQIENEYYSPIRPKRVARSGERPTAALMRGGIEYVEVRSLDLNVFDPVGINQNVMRFVEAFLLYCLLEESPLLGDDAWDELAANHSRTARRGRDPGLRLVRDGRETALADWAREIMPRVAAVAELLDAGRDDDLYAAAVARHAAMVENPELTPSARLLSELREHDASFFEFAMDAARGHRDYFAALEPLPPEREKLFADEAAASLERQAEIEAADTQSFDDYLAAYYATGEQA